MDLVSARITHLCERLKLGTVGAEWPAMAETAVREEASLGEFLERLLAAECEARERRSREVLLKLATLPAIKTLETYDFAYASGAPKKQIGELASALALKATQAGIKTRFISAADLMMQLATAKAQDRLREYMNRAVLGPKLLVIDELGYLPFGRDEANLLFHVIAKRYERAATIVTSNLPFAQWASALADDATLTAALLTQYPGVLSAPVPVTVVLTELESPWGDIHGQLRDLRYARADGSGRCRWPD